MNWIDLLLFSVLLLGLWSGWRQGFIGGALSLLSWTGSFVAGYFLYPFLATFIESLTPALHDWVRPVSFISIVIITRVLFNRVATFLLYHITVETQQQFVNKVFGLVPGFVNGFIQTIVIAALLLTLPIRNRASDEARESRLAIAAAPPAFWLARQLEPVFSDPLRKTFPNATTITDKKEFVKLPFLVAHPRIRQDMEAAMLLLVNEERKKAGLKAVKMDPELQVVARAHVKDMFVRGYFAHVNPDGADPFDRIQKAEVPFTTAGENLALAQTLQQAHEGLMKSPGHRANILQPLFGRLGIGIQDGGIYGLMVAQEFRN